MKGIKNMAELKIRKLTVKDRKTLSRLIKKLAEKIGDTQLLNSISSAKTSTENEEQEENSIANAGIQILQKLIDTLEEETQEWFADLIGKTTEEFLSLPIDTEPKIIEQIIEAEEADSFFILAWQLYSKITKLKSRFSKQKTS